MFYLFIFHFLFLVSGNQLSPQEIPTSAPHSRRSIVLYNDPIVYIIPDLHSDPIVYRTIVSMDRSHV